MNNKLSPVLVPEMPLGLYSFFLSPSPNTAPKPQHPVEIGAGAGGLPDKQTPTFQNRLNVLQEYSGQTFTGPIDNFESLDTSLYCLHCHHTNLHHIPEQSGLCHSGDFWNTCIEHFWCPDCERVYIYPELVSNSQDDCPL